MLYYPIQYKTELCNDNEASNLLAEFCYSTFTSSEGKLHYHFVILILKVNYIIILLYAF